MTALLLWMALPFALLWLVVQPHRSPGRFWWYVALLPVVSVPVLGVAMALLVTVQSLADRPTSASVELSPYRILFVEDTGVLEHERYLLVLRDDGAQARVSIDNDAFECGSVNATPVAERIYFVCSNEGLNESTVSVHTVERSISLPLQRREIALATLDLK